MKYMYKMDHIIFIEILSLNMLFGEWNHPVVITYLLDKELCLIDYNFLYQ